jgi:hypothetical protein
MVQLVGRRRGGASSPAVERGELRELRLPGERRLVPQVLPARPRRAPPDRIAAVGERGGAPRRAPHGGGPDELGQRRHFFFYFFMAIILALYFFHEVLFSFFFSFRSFVQTICFWNFAHNFFS